MADRQRLAALGRVIFIWVAGLEAFLLAAALIGLAITLGVVPSDPGPDAVDRESPSRWDAIPKIALLAILGTPGALGLAAMLNESFPARRLVIAATAVAMVGVAAYSAVFLLTD